MSVGKSVGQRAAEAAVESYRRDPRPWTLKGEATPAHPMFAGYIVCYEEREADLAAAQRERDELRERMAEALIWCSGSEDFAPEGKARAGWLKLCKPLLDELLARAGQEVDGG